MRLNWRPLPLLVSGYRHPGGHEAVGVHVTRVVGLAAVVAVLRGQYGGDDGGIVVLADFMLLQKNANR